jgi:protein farnesyltransferase/geranylgeranyltransferase type-1 subunit alpha
MPDDTTGHVLYAERPEWSDVVPIPQYENIQPLAPIFYSPECMQRCRCRPGCCTDDRRYIVLFHRDAPMDNADKDATDYFRGIVKTGEKSLRVLQLTETIIRLNPAHYSAW